MDIVSLLITWLVITVSLLIVSYIPFIGVEIDSFGKALIAGAVFGILNAIAQAVVGFVGILNFLTLGLLGLIVNIIVFGLAAKLVEGFRLRHGFMSAILGAFFMAIALGLVTKILSLVL